MTRYQRVAALVMLIAASGMARAVQAEVISADGGHYVLRHEGASALSPETMWQRLTASEIWWLSDHTYSGNSANLSLEVTAGGLWLEEWAGGSVEHGRILYLKAAEELRLSAPFGPLQSLPVTVIWSIKLEAGEDGGTRVVFEERAGGPPSAGLDALAPAVDRVKQQAMDSLTARQGG